MMRSILLRFKMKKVRFGHDKEQALPSIVPAGRALLIGSALWALAWAVAGVRMLS